jgi:hypothetical protein
MGSDVRKVNTDRTLLRKRLGRRFFGSRVEDGTMISKWI